MRGQIDLFQPVLKALEDAFREVETKVVPPVRRPWGNSFVFRYTEQTIQQAIVQKLARMISGLHAIKTLLNCGLFQEQGMVQRAVAEIDEDILFLSLAIIHNDVTALHTEFLRHFYAEEFADPSDIVGSHTSRGMSKREKIRGYIHAKGLAGANAARAARIDKVLTKAYSGYIHGASPHIMDMYGGQPARFDINGSTKGARHESHHRDAANYFYRAALTMAAAAKAFGDESLFATVRASADEFGERMKA